MSPPKTRETSYTRRYPSRQEAKHSDLENSSPTDESESEIDDAGPRLRQTSHIHLQYTEDSYDSQSVNDLSSSMEKANISGPEKTRGSPRHRSPRNNSSRVFESNIYPSLDEYKDDSRQCSHDCSRDSTQINVSRDDAQSRLLCIIVLVVVLVVAISLIFIHLRRENVHEELSSNVYIEDIENNLRSIFHNQSPAIWRVIRSQLSLQLQRRVKVAELRPLVRPAVLMVVGTDHGLTMRCFSRKLGVFVAQAFKRSICVRADAEESSDSGHVAKWQMDQVVAQNYKQGDRCFHVQRLGSLSGPELLMLHAWCDGEFSPYKDAVFIISLMMKNNVTEESEIESYLNQQWTGILGADEAPALLSRIANSIVVIKEEKPTSIFKSHCLT